MLNTNSAPYFDDYSETKDFHQILHVPGKSLQVRELNQSQTILQNQIKRIGDHLFRNGSMVIPGQITLDTTLNYVKLDEPVSTNTLELIDPQNSAGTEIVVKGNNSGVKAKIIHITPAEGFDPVALFVKYLDSGSTGSYKTFLPGETLVNWVSGAPAGTVGVVNSDGVGLGSAANIQEGVYYIQGYLVKVRTQSLILDKFNSAPSYKIGLEIVEEIITEQDDFSLNDNAQGEPNYAAPGAHRRKITLELSKRSLESNDESTFVELLRVRNGVIERSIEKTEYSVIEETLARRTYDESGDYTVRPFSVQIREHLDDGTNNGVYTSARGGNESLLAAALSAGKAYVRGFEIETLITQNLPVSKARDYSLQNNALVRANQGNYILVTRMFGLMNVSTLNKIDLYDSWNASNGQHSGNLIGTARVRGVEYHSGTIGNGATTAPYPIYKMFIFDMKLNAGKTINDVQAYYIADSPAGGFSGASGYLVNELIIRNPVGTFPATETLVGTTGAETIISWDATSGKMYTRPSTVAIPEGSSVTCTVAAAVVGSGKLYKRTKVFDTVNTPLLFPLPQSYVKSIRDANGNSDTTFTVKKYFSTTSSGANVTFTTGVDETFAPFSVADYVMTKDGQPVDIVNLGYSFNGSANQFTVNTVPAGAVRLIAPVTKSIGYEKTKTLQSNVGSPLSVTLVGGKVPTTISLGKSDIYRLVSVKEKTSNLDITSHYKLDNGQRDTHYEYGSLTLLPDTPNSTDPAGLDVVFEYFVHSGNGYYFSVDSYQSFTGDATWFQKIPTYQSPATGAIYDLRSYLDFRPVLGASSSYSGVSIVKPNSDVRCDFSYYLGRIDKIYLDFKGNFKVIKGTSSLNPTAPPDPKDGMVLYVLKLKPYTFTTKDVDIRFIENRRYTMRDIGNIERRVGVLEYYTALNLLEKDTADMNIIDSTTGLDRFKSGFIVDPFVGHDVGDVWNQDYKCSIDPTRKVMRPMHNTVSLDMVFEPTRSANFEYRTKKLDNDLVTLKYSEEAYIIQPLASHVENINPFAIFSWVGSLELDPPNDVWKDTERRPDILVTDDTALDNVRYMNGNVLGTIWNEWVTNWSGQTSDGYSSTQTRTGTTTTVVPNVVRREYQDKVVNVTIVPYIRSRYVKFTAKRLKPLTKFYPFFDGYKVTEYCKPVDPNNPTDSLYPGPEESLQLGDRALISDGFGNLTGWFKIPAGIFKTGSRTFRLVDDPDNSSRATSFADAKYTCTGLLETVQGTITAVREPKFETRTVSESRVVVNQYTNTSVVQNTPSEGPSDTSSGGSSLYGMVTTPYGRYATSDPSLIGKYVANPVFDGSTVVGNGQPCQLDPVAQTFFVTGKGGGTFISAIDIFFNKKDESMPVTLQVREVVNGYPTSKIIPFGQVTMYPDQINLPVSGVPVATKFSFQSPLYLQNDQEYAFCVIAYSTNYEIFVSKLGEKVINGDQIINVQPYTGSMFKSQNSSTWTAEQFEDIMFTVYRCVFDINSSATLYFTNPQLPYTELESSPFITSKGSSKIRIKHKNHGLSEGSQVVIFLPLSELTANSGSPNVYNGISCDVFDVIPSSPPGYLGSPYTHMSEMFTVTNVDLDSYMIDVGVSATASGKTGPAKSLAAGNFQMDVLYPMVQQLEFANTKIDWSMRTITGKSVDGIQIPYAKSSAFEPIVVNNNVEMSVPSLIASTNNETAFVTGPAAFNRKSLVLQAVMTSLVDNLSPVIDTKRVSAIVVGNRIDSGSIARNVDGFDNFDEYKVTGTDISFTGASGATGFINKTSGGFSHIIPHSYIKITGTASNNTTGTGYVKVTEVTDTKLTVSRTVGNFVNESAGGSFTIWPLTNYMDETAPNGASGAAKYISRKVTLVNPANSLKVYLAAMRPAESSLDVYYRVLGPDSSDLLDNMKWVKMTGGANNSQVPRNTEDFQDYTWEASQIGDFISFSIKIVMRSTDTSKIPECKEFRCIALGT